MSFKAIPHLQISGDHFEAGRQLGAATASLSRRPFLQPEPPAGHTWPEMRALAQPYLAATRAAIPWLHAEMEGIAAGSGIDLLDLYVHATEEIWPDPPAAARSADRCSDIAAGPLATADGGVWLAHNNDLAPDVLEEVVSVEWAIPGQPRLFTLGLGPFISVGFNSAGLALTGNELSANDDKPGVPRLLIVRDILAQTTVEAALSAAARPERASSYNNLISHAGGTIVNFEGSATDYELSHPQDGWLVHTNHYCSARMAVYERNPGITTGSRRRYERAGELMANRTGPVTPAMLKGFLADHANAPDSLCKHQGQSQTAFWCIINLSGGAIEYGPGQPCESAGQRFRFSHKTQ